MLPMLWKCAVDLLCESRSICLFLRCYATGSADVVVVLNRMLREYVYSRLLTGTAGTNIYIFFSYAVYSSYQRRVYWAMPFK